MPDKNLDAAIKAALPHHKGDLTDQALGNVFVLDASNKGITDLTGLDKCPNLAELRLAKNQVSDLKPLAGLKNLQSLTLTGNKIADLAPLAGLTKLQYLEISDNQVADLAPLEKLTEWATKFLTPQGFEMLLDLLRKIAEADGEMHERERKILGSVRATYEEVAATQTTAGTAG